MVHLNMVFRCPLVLMVIALVSLVGCGSGETEAVQPQQEISDAQARALYTRKCSLCHGNDGKLGASRATDLSTSNLSFDRRVASITYGKGTMPGQKGILNAAEIAAIAHYIERFRE